MEHIMVVPRRDGRGGGLAISGSIASDDKGTTYGHYQKKKHIASSCSESVPEPKDADISGYLEGLTLERSPFV